MVGSVCVSPVGIKGGRVMGIILKFFIEYLNAMISSVLLYLTLSALHAFAGPLVERDAPTVTLDGTTFTGKTSGTHTKFLGIPFAQPP